MSIGYEELRDAAYKSVGLHPNWTPQAAIEDTLPGTPTDVSDGVDVSEAVVALLRVELREVPGRQRGWVRVVTVTNTHLYTATVNGTACDFTSDGSATEQEILTGLKASIEAGVGAAVTVEQIADGTYNWLRIQSKTAATFTLAVSAELADSIEASSVTFRVWGRARNQTAHDLLAGYDGQTITDNWIQRIEIGGFDRLFIEVTATDGRTVPEVGPCLLTE